MPNNCNIDMFSNRKKYCLKAMTLPEVLVMMIIAGIVLLSVMDGLWLFRRYTNDVTDRLTRNSRFYDGFYRLEDIINNADSLTGTDSRVQCWSGGAEKASVAVADSVLIATYAHSSDTLLSNVADMRVHRKENGGKIDSLTITLVSDGENIVLLFEADIPIHIKERQSITRKEKDYEYE